MGRLEDGNRLLDLLDACLADLGALCRGPTTVQTQPQKRPSDQRSVDKPEEV